MISGKFTIQKRIALKRFGLLHSADLTKASILLRTPSDPRGNLHFGFLHVAKSYAERACFQVDECRPTRLKREANAR